MDLTQSTARWVQCWVLQHQLLLKFMFQQLQQRMHLQEGFPLAPSVFSIFTGHRRLILFLPVWIPSWDLSVVLEGLSGHSFKPLESTSYRFLTLKIVLLVALFAGTFCYPFLLLAWLRLCYDLGRGIFPKLLRPYFTLSMSCWKLFALLAWSLKVMHNLICSTQ